MQNKSGIKIAQEKVVKNIKLTGSDGEIECRIDKIGIIMLKTEFLKSLLFN